MGFRVCVRTNETADLSTPLRSGRDDKFVATLISNYLANLSSRPERSWAYDPPKGRKSLRSTHCLCSHRIVISTEAKRSGEICGFWCLIGNMLEFSRRLFSPCRKQIMTHALYQGTKLQKRRESPAVADSHVLPLHFCVFQ